MERWPLFMMFMMAGCAIDEADFRPARGARDYPAERDAYRAKSEADVDGCESIGVVHSRGAHPTVEELAVTVRNHGGTHYIVRGEQHEDAYETTGTATRFGGGYLVHARTEVDHMRSLWAQAYRCR